MSLASWTKQVADGKVQHTMPYRARKAKNAARKKAQREQNLARRRMNSNHPVK